MKEKKSTPQLSGASLHAFACFSAISRKAYAFYATVVMLFLSSPIFAQPNLSGSQGQQAGSNADIDPLYQKIYNILSVVVTITAIVYIVKPIKGLFSSEAGSQAQDGERKGHLMQLASIAIGLVIWYFGVPYIIKLGFK